MAVSHLLRTTWRCWCCWLRNRNHAEGAEPHQQHQGEQGLERGGVATPSGMSPPYLRWDEEEEEEEGVPSGPLLLRTRNETAAAVEAGPAEAEGGDRTLPQRSSIG